MAGSKIEDTIATSFELLSDKRKAQAQGLFAEKIKQELREKLYLSTADLAKQREIISSLLAYYSNELAVTNPAIFRFLTKAQTDRLRNQLLFTFYLLYAQYQLDVAEGRNYTLNDHDKVLDLCAKRIEQLDGSAMLDEQSSCERDCERDLQLRINASDKCLQFLGMILLAPWFVEKMQQFMAGKTVALKKWMTEINNKRLYWVWGGGMLTSILEMLPDDFYNKQQAQQGLAIPIPISGYMSWVLYYTRFGINLLLVTKHVYNPWMNTAEKEIDPWERFQTQWQQRKFALLNDFIWATANMLCFFWLKGSGRLGYAGNVLTALLLFMDLSLTTWKYWEESTKHNTDLLAFERDRKKLEKQKDNLTEELLNLAQLAMAEDEQLPALRVRIKELGAKQDDLGEQITRLDKMRSKNEFDWKYQCYGLVNDLAYALGLMLAFCVVCSFFFPPAAIVPATAMMVEVIGSTMCFVLTVAYTAISSRIDIAKIQQTSLQAKARFSDLFEAFKKETHGNIKKQLHLEMKGLLAESDYQERIANFQAIKLVRSVLIDAFIPTLIFSALMFLPLNMSLGVLASALVLAMISNTMINRYEPQAKELPDFNEEEYSYVMKSQTVTEFEEKLKLYAEQQEAVKKSIAVTSKKSRGFCFFHPGVDEEQKESVTLNQIDWVCC